MAKTKISEFSTTAGNNTDINSINIAEGCAPSGINDAIRELMRQLKEFQTGGAGDSVNSGGDFSVATNKFTVASASGNTAVAGTLAVTGTTTLTGALVANGNATLGDGSGDTVTVKGTPTLEVNPTLSGGTANGVLYLNGSKVATSGSALTFDGTNLGLSGTGSRFINLGSTSTNGQSVALQISAPNSDASASVYRIGSGLTADNELVSYDVTNGQTVDKYIRGASGFRALFINGSEGMRLTSTGLGIGTSSPASKLHVSGASAKLYIDLGGNNYYQASNQIWQNYGGGTEYMRLDSSGNLGLGVTPNTWTSGWRAFEIATSGSSVFSNGASSIGLGQGFYNNSGSKYAQSSYAVGGYQINAGVHSWLIAGLGTAGNAVSFTQAMTLDASGNLGVGASSPSAKLEVNGNQIVNYSGQSQSLLTVGGGSTSAAVNLRGSTGSAYAWQISSNSFVASALEFTRSTAVGGTTFSTPSMLLDSSGNLGLGVTPSAWADYKALQMPGAAFLGYSDGSGNNQAIVAANCYWNGANWIYRTTDQAARYSLYDGQAIWYTAPSGTAGDTITFTQAMTLNASGNLGVGATSPSGRLHIATGGETTSRFDGSRGSADNLPVVTIPFWNVSNGVGDKQIATIGVLTGTSSNQTQKGQIYFSTSDGTLTERARIDSSGNFNVGTAIADAGRLNINGVGGTSSPTSLYIETSASGTTDYALRIYNSGTTALFTIRTDGVVNTGAATNSPVNLTTANAANVYVGGASGTLYKSTSSRKYKRDIENTPRGLVDLLKLRAVIYKQKTADVDGNIPDTVHGGLIAEEVHDAGLTEFVQYADDGTPDALAYGHMVSLCVKAIQEQQVLIQQLTARVAQLESN